MSNRSTHPLPTSGLFLLAVAVCFTIMFIGCTDDVTGPEDPQIDRVVISPESVELEVGEQVEFSFELLTEAGEPVDTEDLDMETEWISTDDAVFTVDEGGTAVGQSPGEEFCIIDVTVDKGSSNFTGRDTAVVFVF